MSKTEYIASIQSNVSSMKSYAQILAVDLAVVRDTNKSKFNFFYLITQILCVFYDEFLH